MLFMRKSPEMPTAATALPGRATPIPTATHALRQRPQAASAPYPGEEGFEQAVFALGCF